MPEKAVHFWGGTRFVSGMAPRILPPGSFRAHTPLLKRRRRRAQGFCPAMR